MRRIGSVWLCCVLTIGCLASVNTVSCTEEINPLEGLGQEDSKTAESLFDTEFLKITASDGTAGDVFGTAVSLSGSTLVVGACQDISGSAYVYERDLGGAENWGERTKLTPGDGANNDNFGWSVSINGDTIVIGAFFDDVGANPDQGSAYVYERDYGGPDNWGEVTKLTASDGAGNDRFGWSVSIFGDTIVAGAYGDQIGANAAQGSAYVFERDLGGADNWGERIKLTAADGLANDYFGSSVSVYGDTLVIGAFGDDIGANNDQGSAYLLERDLGGANNWGQVTKVTASDGGTFDFLGWSASISIDTIVVGAYFATVGPSSFQGAAYVFERDFGGPDNWGEVAKLTASDGESLDYFGFSVSINVDTIVAGAYYDDVGANGDQGSACVFGRNEGGAENWGQVTNLTGSDSTANDHFGSSVTINGDTAVVGANTDDIGAVADQGSAYIYKLSVSVVIPDHLEYLSGDGQSGNVVTSVAPFWARVVDQFDNDVPGAMVWWNITNVPGGAVGQSLSNITSISDANGLISTTLTLGNLPGWYNVTCANLSLPGVPDVITFNTTSFYNLSLNEGWNLISLPFIQPDTSIDQALSSIDGKWDYIQVYNTTDPDHWKTNATFKPDQLNDLKSLDHKTGFWINIIEANVNLTVNGNVSTSTSIPLYAGWNLVGYPSLTEKNIADSLAGTGYDRPVEAFNATAPYRISPLADTYMMKPGEGYWVHVPADTVWVIDW